MSLRSKLTKSPPYLDDFWEYTPDNYGDQEEQGMRDWPVGKGSLPYIPSSSGAPLAALPAILKKMLDSAWTAANPSQGPLRPDMPQIGSHKPAVSLPNQQPYQKLSVPPTRSPEHSQLVKLAPHLESAFAADWSVQKSLPRVRAFTFRGDTRSPGEVKKAGGFHPPITRSDDHYLKKTIYPQFSKWLASRTGRSITETQFLDGVNKAIPVADRSLLWQYGLWRLLAETEQFHLGRMLAEEAMKGFISTTKATTVAKAFAGENGGWVYVVHIDGGYLVPDKGQHQWTAIFGEQEIAMPGSVPWENVMGFRQLAVGVKKFTGPVYLRDTFDAQESAAAERCHKLLGGLKQP